MKVVVYPALRSNFAPQALKERLARLEANLEQAYSDLQMKEEQLADAADVAKVSAASQSVLIWCCSSHDDSFMWK